MSSIRNRLAYLAVLCPVALIGIACTAQNRSVQQREAMQGYPAYGTLGTPQRFEGMGAYSRSVTTESAEAQAFFDQGLNWLYGFNHDEAVLSFQRATELDPGCAMCWWGIAYAQGPNYNDPMMSPARVVAARTAMRHGIDALDDETAAERRLVEALTVRYPDTLEENPAGAQRAELTAAFAAEMRDVWAGHPQDPDIGTLFADAMMLNYPWMLYRHDGEPARPQTLEIVETLEAVLAMNPQHPGANHLYIHAIEPSNDKARALPAADALSDAVPAVGHLLHMPSHIYVQTGMWDKAIEQNRKAMAADAEYRALAPNQLIQHAYMAHNAHMLAFAAMMVGREQEALTAARSMWEMLPEEMIKANGAFLDPIMCSVYDVQKRFGRWDELLAEQAPPEYLPMTTAIWRAHRAIAYAAKHDFESASAEQAKFREALRAVPDDLPFPPYGLKLKALLVSEFFVSGEILLQQGMQREAIMMLEQAALIEDTLGYAEPPMWLQPVRHTLGVAQLQAGEYAAAERTYREDLRRWPRNGWSLLGLSQALEGQGDREGAALARREFSTVWAKADVNTKTSCRCVPELTKK